MTDNYPIWLIIFGMGLGSFGLRFVFLGLIGDRAMPEWMLRHLRYTAVAVLPALVAPLVVWPTATGGQTDPTRLLAAGLAFAIGYWFKSIYAAMGAGAAVMVLAPYWPF